MNYKIYSRWDGTKVLFEREGNSLREVVIAAVGSDANLSGANLRDASLSDASLSGANLRDADLSDANLRGADLRDADLRDADLSDADLRDADLSDASLSGANLSYADLRGANLRDADLSDANLRGADLRDASLRDADLSDASLSDASLSGANLSYADLRGASLRDASLRDVPYIESIHQKVYAAASQPEALDMSDWHTCETTHCRAGWVITLAGDEGKNLEEKIGPAAAATLIYLKSDPSIEKIPSFHCSNEAAMEDMKKLAEMEAAR